MEERIKTNKTFHCLHFLTVHRLLFLRERLRRREPQESEQRAVSGFNVILVGFLRFLPRDGVVLAGVSANCVTVTCYVTPAFLIWLTFPNREKKREILFFFAIFA